jgi:hypothetical protein
MSEEEKKLQNEKLSFQLFLSLSLSLLEDVNERMWMNVYGNKETQKLLLRFSYSQQKKTKPIHLAIELMEWRC